MTGKPVAKRTSPYWYVWLGRLDELNGPGTYPFPSQEAAMRFAKTHGTNRSVRVRNRFGRVVYATSPRTRKVIDAR